MPRSLAAPFAVTAALTVCAAAGAAATDPQLQTVAADQTWADSIVLGSGDMGSTWQSAPVTVGGGSSNTRASCNGFDPNEADLTVTGNTVSDDFSRPDGSYVSSSATVWATPDEAQADWERNLQPGLLRCFAQALVGSSTKSVKIAVTSKGPMTFPALAGRTAAYRFVFTASTKVRVKKKLRKISVKADFDLVFVGNGRATAGLALVYLAKTPLSAAYEQSLAQILADRTGKDPAAPASSPSPR